MKSRSFLARAGALLASKGLQDAIQAVLLLWLARMDRSDYGLFVFGAGMAAMVRAGLSLGLDQYTLREFSIGEEPRGPLLAQMAKVKSILGGVVLGGLGAFSLLKEWGSTQTLVVMVIVLGQIMEGVGDTFYNIFRAEGRQVREGLYRAGANLIGAAYGAACLFMGLGVFALAFFLVISNGLKLIAAIAGVVWLRLAPAWHQNSGLLPKDQVRAILIIAGVNVLGSFYNCIQIFLLKQFHSLTEVAFYGAASDLSGGISGLVAHIIVGAVLFPSLVAAAAKGPEHLAVSVRTYFWQLVTYGIGLAFFLSTLGGWVLTMLYGAKYTASVAPLRILGPATLLSFVNNFGVYTLLALRQERLLLLYHFLPALLSLVLGMLVIPGLGPMGAAVNLLASRVAMTILIVGWLQRRLGLITWFESRRILNHLLVMGSIYLSLVWLRPLAAGLAALLVYGLSAWHAAVYSGGRRRGRASY